MSVKNKIKDLESDLENLMGIYKNIQIIAEKYSCIKNDKIKESVMDSVSKIDSYLKK